MEYTYLNDTLEVANTISKRVPLDQILFKQVVGSRFFETFNASSDYDLKVVTIPKKEFFMPNTQMVILGFDNVKYLNSDQYNSVEKDICTIKTADGSTTKCEIFYCDIPLHFRMIVEGAYFVLVNTFIQNEKTYFFNHPSYMKYEKVIRESIPKIAYARSLHNLSRDIHDLMKILSNQKISTNKIKIKRAGQYALVANTIMLRSLQDHGVDYSIFRDENTPLEVVQATCLNLLNSIQVYLSNFNVGDIALETGVYKRTVALMLNDIYSENVFTII